jgi:hypothetical protein
MENSKPNYFSTMDPESEVVAAQPDFRKLASVRMICGLLQLRFAIL